MELPKKVSDALATLQDFLANCDENDRNKVHESMKDIVARNDKPRGRKRKVSEIIDELGESMHVKVKKVDGGKILITAQEKTVKHGISLPDEIWSKIFSYLPTKTILGTLTQVSRHFNQIATNPTLITNLKIHGLMSSERRNVIKVIERSMCLSELSISEFNDCKKLLPIALKSCPKLKTLKIGYGSQTITSPFSDDDEDGDEDEDRKLELDSETAQAITEFASLENLNINLLLSREAMEKIVSIKKLKTLAITSYRMKITHEDVEAIANFDHLENLSLNFGGTTVGFGLHDIQMANHRNDQIKGAMNTLFDKQESALKRLTIQSDCLTKTHVGILETLDLCKNLEVFGNGNLPLNKTEIEALCRLPKLKKIRLMIPSIHRSAAIFALVNQGNPGNPPNPNIAAKANFKAFVTNGLFEELEHLNLSENDYFDHETMKCLSVRSLPKLKSLNLNHCEKLKLNDDLLLKLADNCPNLKFLHLFDVGVRDVSDEVIRNFWLNRKLLVVHPEKERSLMTYMENNKLLKELSQYQKEQFGMMNIGGFDLELDFENAFMY